jgi:hypothetical protein
MPSPDNPVSGHAGLSMAVTYQTQAVGDVEVFYREAGPAGAPVIVLLTAFRPPATCFAI